MKMHKGQGLWRALSIATSIHIVQFNNYGNKNRKLYISLVSWTNPTIPVPFATESKK